MTVRNGRHWVVVVAAVVILEIALMAFSATVPAELHGVIVLVGAGIGIAVYLGLYALQRARHW